jgi:hypothetical protein
MNWNDLIAQILQPSPSSGLTAQIVSAIAAAVTAVTAITASIFAFQQVRLSRRLRQEQAQPYVALYMEPSVVSPHFIDLVVKNYGTTAARNIEINISPQPMRSGDGGQPAEPIDYPRQMPTLVPAQEWRTLWDFGPARIEQGLPGKYTAVVKFDGALQADVLSFTYHLDWELFSSQRWVQTYGMHDAAKALREMEKHMRGWREGANRGLKVYVRDGDKRDEQLRQGRAEAVLEHERLMNRLRPEDKAEGDE